MNDQQDDPFDETGSPAHPPGMATPIPGQGISQSGSSSPASEEERLDALRSLMVLDSSPEPIFDSIAKMAADICGVPIALMSLVDKERQWFKANVGLGGVRETPREVAFCAHAILQADLLEVPDATRDARFADNPLVTGSPEIRFYAGVPVTLPGGERVGTLCVIDRTARTLNGEQRAALRSLSDVASHALVMRRDLLRQALSGRSLYEQALLHSESHYRAIVEDQEELISLARPDGQLTYVNHAYARHFGMRPTDMVGRSLFNFVEPVDCMAVRAQLDEVVHTGRSMSQENRMVAADGERRWVAWTNAIQRDSSGGMLLRSVGRDISQRRETEEALRASQSFLYRTGRAAGVGGWELELVSDALTWSDETRRIHEVEPDYMPTLEGAIAFYAPDARALLEEAIRSAISKGVSWDLELPLVTARGRPIWVRAVGAVEYENGQPVRLIGAFQDVTERKGLEHRLASQTAMLRSITESIPATVGVVNPDEFYVFVNSAFERWCGRSRDQVIGRTAREVLGEIEYERRRPWIERAVAGESVVFELDYVGTHGPNYVSVTYVPLVLEDGTIDGFVVVTQDVTHQRREAARLLALSQRDALTGLLNRSGFEQRLEGILLAGGGEAIVLLYIDLDGFKQVNDLHGHAAGDEVLKLFGARLATLVRPTDAVTRLGGDEFAIAIEGTRELANATAVAAKIVEAARKPFSVAGVEVRIGASVGIAIGTDVGEGWATLVARADAQLLAAKAAGKGRHAGGSA